MSSPDPDVIVIGAGQAGLAVAYYLRRTALNYLLLDAGEAAGGAWAHTWDSLRLFSPAAYSSLPGWQMPPSQFEGYPSRKEVIDYLARYEQRYDVPISRNWKVKSVTREGDYLRVGRADGTSLNARAVVSATGTWSAPFTPDYSGRNIFKGVQLHSAHYRNPQPFVDKRVLVVGGGNSGAQILAELSEVARTIWVTVKEPVFLPDEIDGRILFERASARALGNADATANTTLGDIVMLPSVKKARDRGALTSARPFDRFTESGVVWKDGSASVVDAVLWCTGFRPATHHLKPLGLVEADGRIEVIDQQAKNEPRLWLAGYGNWTGAASATLLGASRTARAFVPRLAKSLL
ncbi:MAG: ArsO family NAD(P)H-dependent flavin-containing monooxygenase [Ferrovibrio sp.]|uniref:ArsO family NAD(P)H-dependent flavin-containing monooxygenase n=1 Tax=Ferrovibrio sp. TaxID=1917215 RepID=UPI003918D23E